ncbi:MFS transporter [Evansella sp. AB-rgal1]|uniref:MFS transporter n=1 Tax=Evansella sp. AB-rgal1 TaxID=3242696 RepID=UPI00359EED9E
MLLFLYTIIIVAFLDTFIQLPIISTYAHSLGASSFFTGIIIAIYSFSNMIGNAISGHWIDRYGRKRILLIGMIFVAIILLFYPFIQTPWGLFSVRFIHGLAGGALIPAAFAYLGDLAPSHRRGKTMAFSGACIGTAAIIGPAMGGIISSHFTISAVFYSVSILFLLTSLLSLILLKESLTTENKKQVKIKDMVPLLKNPIMIQAALSAFALMMSMGVLTYSLPLKVEALSLSSAVTGLLLSSFGLVAIIIFLSPINRLFDKYQATTFILIGMGFISFSLISLSLLQSIQFMTFIMFFYGIGFSFIFPSMNRMILEISTMETRGKAFGIFYGAFSLGVVFGSSFAGAMSQAFGYPLLLSGIAMFVIAILFYFLVFKKERKYQIKMN